MTEKNDGYRQSKEDLENHFTEQLLALESSALAYDEGNEWESKRLSVALRVLLHEGTGHSLLGQLKRENLQFYDTVPSATRTQGTSTTGFLLVGMDGKYYPMFDSLPFGQPRWIDFKSWWAGTIFTDNQQTIITRSEVVLSVANKDGGAHVDPVLHAKYANLSKNNSMGWRIKDAQGDRPFDSPHLAAIRQITHEVLKSIKPGYSFTPKHKIPTMVVAPILTPLPPGTPLIDGAAFDGEHFYPNKPIARAPKIGRNQPCFCGSGKKYKRCHG
jgi:hypothetical protein